MNASEGTIIHWFEELDARKKSGAGICPALTREPGRFAPSQCNCDIPVTRAAFESELGTCYEGDRCLPRDQWPEPVHAELYPPRDYTSQPTHFAGVPEENIGLSFAAIRAQQENLDAIRTAITAKLPKTS